MQKNVFDEMGLWAKLQSICKKAIGDGG